MKLTNKSKADPSTNDDLTTKEFIRRGIASHRQGMSDVRKLLRESDNAATAALAESAPPNLIEFWAACLQIPQGYTVSYATLSRVIQGVRGEQTEVAKLSRAAGKAMSLNPMIPTIPCHRVVGANGVIVGFTDEGATYTLAMKAARLTGEGVPVEQSGERFIVRRHSGRLLN
ncbi:Hypothetical protein, putative [Bodo saltans]|uniref:Methylated-DNA--protein-cysteine methyltransferase n=1 Tax=Bodo saltans TaxID=75058 RepID=A0A0S4JD61_BODSA|nr:Hypothetical protein, putative [Bodo saltans]|eukprot:CUG89395.1 Hypothetical protein, putative [Bodo saltans]